MMMMTLCITFIEIIIYSKFSDTYTISIYFAIHRNRIKENKLILLLNYKFHFFLLSKGPNV